MNIRKIAIGSVGLAILAGIYFATKKSVTPSEKVSPADQELAVEEDPTPLPSNIPLDWKMKKFWDIHKAKPSVFEKDVDFVIQGSEKISEWFDVEYDHEGQHYLLFVTKVQSLTETGEPQSGHGQSILAGAGLYKKDGESWDLVVANDNIGEFGAYGDAPQVQKPLVLDVGPHRKAVLIESSFCNQGECQSTGSLIETSLDRLEEIGSLSIGGDNSGQCNDESDLKCYRFSATVESIPDDSKDYFDIVLKKTGRELGEDGAVAAVHDTMVSYQDGKYEEMK